VCATGFGLAAVWLLGAGLARRSRALSIVLMALAFAAVSLLAFAYSPGAEQVQDASRWVPLLLLYLVLFWITGGLVYAGALNLMGCICRQQLDRVRVSVWLPFCLWALWLAAASVLAGVVTLVSGGGFDWVPVVMGSSVVALVSFAVVLPLLILSFACPFYRERLKSLLRLPPPEAAPAAAASPQLASQQVGSR
jgi:hypothetical protein